MSSRGSDYVFLSRHDLGEQTGTIDARTIEKSSIIAYEGDPRALARREPKPEGRNLVAREGDALSLQLS